MSFYEFFNLFRKPRTLHYESLSPISNFHRGIPLPSVDMDYKSCDSCKSCETLCPTKAIEVKKTSLRFDYGKCVQCGICKLACPDEKILNSNITSVFALNRDSLVVEFSAEGPKSKEDLPSLSTQKFRELTKNRGFTYREVAAAGNNTVECELNASFNNVFDSESLGVRSVASPKHADALLYSGPIGKNMQTPLDITWECMPEPKALIACGTEAISGGLFAKGKTPRSPDLFIVGDPPRPDVILQSFRYLMGSYKHSLLEIILNFYKSIGDKK